MSSFGTDSKAKKYQAERLRKLAGLDGFSPNKPIVIDPALPWEERLRLWRLEQKRLRLAARKNAGGLDDTYSISRH